MATISAVRHQRPGKMHKINYNALKELEKGTSHKEVAARFGVSKSTLSTWKITRRKFFKRIKVGLWPKELNQKNTRP